MADADRPEVKPRILFVEDEAIVREHLAQQLSSHYVVETASDGEQALRAILRSRPDLIITDLLMPGLDGVELVKTLRATPSTATIPVLMISGRAAEDIQLEGFEVGADAFLAKPYTERELRVRIRSMLQSARVRTEAAQREAQQRMEHEAMRERAALLESISDAFFAVDGQWRVTYINQRALDHFSTTRQKLVGKVLWEAIPVGKGTFIEEEYRRVMLGKRPAAFEFLSPLTGRWIDVHAYPTPQGIAVNFRDITIRKRAEADLRELTATLEQRVEAAIAERDKAWSSTQEANARMRTVFETSYQYQCFISPEGSLLDANRTSLASIRCELGDVVGRWFWETPWFTNTPGMSEQIKDYVSQVAKGETFRKEISVHLPIGLRTFDFSMRPVFDEARQLIGIVPEAVDVTDRNSAAEQIAHMQKMETIGQLTGGVAHDFNNLLTPIVGVLDMLNRKLDGDRRLQRLTAGALQAADRARTLIQRLLAFARKQHLEARAVDIKQLLDGILELLTRSLGPQIQIKMQIQEPLPPARVDQNQLELALLNLALNARDAMPNGGTLDIVAKSDLIERQSGLAPGHYVSISVIDTGKGMDALTLKRSIEPFYTTKAPGHGTGLGLSMVHGLAAQSGGDLSLTSTPDHGTTATLWLPVSAEGLEDEASDARKELISSRAPAATILLVDDEELVRASTAAMLSDAGYNVIEAASAAEGLALAQRDKLEVNAVVTDYAMPGMTGVQLAQALHAVKPAVPVLMITGFANLSDQDAGGFPRLAKPFRQTDLVASVAELLDRRSA